MVTEILRYLKDYWAEYPVIKDPIFLCKYYRKLNKYIPLEFLLLTSSSGIAGIIYSASFFIGSQQLRNDFFIGSPIFGLYSVVTIIVCIYVLYLGNQSGLKGHKLDIEFQKSINRKLAVCPVTIFLGMILITLVAAKFPNSFISICHCWVMTLMNIVYSSLLFIDRIWLKILHFFVFNLIFCYIAYGHPDFSEAVIGRIIAPFGLGAIFFIGYDRLTKNSFILKQRVKGQKMLYEEFLSKFQDSVLILDHDQILFENELATNTIGDSIEKFNKKSGYVISAQGKCLHDEIQNRLNNQSAIEATSKKERYYYHNEECDKLECQKILLVTIIESRAFSHGKTVGLILHDMTSDINEEKKRTDERFRNMTLYSLSHELRTPLNILQGALIIARPLKNKSEEDKNCYVSAKSAWNYMRNKINDTLVYAQLLTNEFALHTDTFKFDRFMNYLRKMTLFMLQKKSVFVEVIFEISSEFPSYFICDRERLEQILFNLLQNAVKYTEQGSIKLFASIKNNISIFEVTDTGCGMSKKEARTLFHSENGVNLILESEDMPKRGLSLTVAQMLCEKLGWKISVSSIVGKGTAFKLEIPMINHQDHVENLCLEKDSSEIETVRQLKIANEDLQIRTRKSPQIKTMLNLTTGSSLSKKDIILIVDDNDFNRMVARKMLAKYSFRIEEADNGKIAVSKIVELQKRYPDTKILVFMDLSMPVMNGIDATQRIRELDVNWKNRPFITALTAFASEAERNSCKDVGMNWFLSKPLTKDSIEKILTQSGFT